MPMVRLLPGESEAQTYIGSINRGQQAYFLESSDFADSLDKLGLGIQEETDNYKYEIIPRGR